jgi:multiple sugar transport system substrate-binding protein
VKQLNDPNLVVPCSYGAFDYTDMHQGMLHEEVQKYLLGKESAEDSLGKITGELQKRMQKYLKDNPKATVETPKSLS